MLRHAVAASRERMLYVVSKLNVKPHYNTHMRGAKTTLRDTETQMRMQLRSTVTQEVKR